MRIKTILLILIFFTFHSSAQKVGLVLSGGGAKGITHIGVIKALEESGIPIDYITGTSMGAIIGGLYASGYSPEEMISIFTSEEFPLWISGEIDTKYTYYFKDNSNDASWFNFKFDPDSLVLPSIIPTNMISPYQMDFAFLGIFSGAEAVARYDFDSLFIPFRCVASDITETQAVVFRKGSLSKAIRASMTFPFFFKPIVIDGKLLFDGGMYNNFPVDVMVTDFNPDIMIGCKAASNYPPPDKNNVISQIQTMLMTKTDFSMPPGKSIMICPDLPTINLLDFSQVSMLIDSGYHETMRKIPEIKKMLSRESAPSDVFMKRALFKLKKPAVIIDTVIFSGVTRSQSRYLEKSLVHKAKYITLENLKTEYFKIISDDKIQSLFPSLKFDSADNYFNMFLDVEKEKTLTVDIGGNVSSKSINEAYFGVQYKKLSWQAYTFSGNVHIGRFYSSAFLGLRADFTSKLPYYVEGYVCFNQWDYFKTTTYFFEDKTPSYLIKNDNHFAIDVGLPYRNNGKFVFGGATGYIRNDYYQKNSFSRTDTADKSIFEFFTAHMMFEINTLNRKEYANKGVKTLINARYIVGNETFEPGSTSNNNVDYSKLHDWLQIKLAYQNYFQHIGKLSLGFYLETTLSSQSFFNNYTATMLMAPALEVIPESRTMFLPKFRAHNYMASGIQLVYSIFSKLDYRVEAYVFQPYQEILPKDYESVEYGEVLSSRSLMAGCALVFHSPFGPVSLSLNYYDKSKDKYSFIFNIGYIIFNKRPLQ